MIQRNTAMDKNRSVLIVDDMVDFGQSLAEVLAMEGYSPVFAESAGAAQELMARFHPEVVLMDIRLGNANGIDLMVQLKSAHSDIQVIIMTAYATIETVIRALEQGAYGYLQKPVEEEELLITLDRCFETIDLKRSKQQAEEALRHQKDQLQTLNQRLRQVVDSAQQVVAASNTDRFDAVLLAQFAGCLHAEGGSYYEVRDQYLKRAASIGGDHAPREIALPLKKGCVFEACLRRKTPILIQDIRQSAGFASSGWQGYRDGSMVAFPLIGESGMPTALVSLHNRILPPFTEQDLELGTLLASHCQETRRAVSAIYRQHKSEIEFERLFNNLPDIYFQLDPSGAVTLVSPSVTRIAGYAPDDLIGRDFADFVVDDDNADYLLNAVRTGTLPERLEYHVRAKDGSTRWMSFNIKYIRDEQGHIVALEGTARDETLMKNSEEERLRLAAAVEQTADMVVITDIGGAIRYVNPAFEHTSGFTLAEVMGQPLRTFQAGVNDMGAFARTWKAAQAGDLGRCTLTNRKKDGTCYEEEVTISAIRSEVGKVINFLALKRDITIEKKITEQLVHAQKMEAVGALAGGIAHDFNNILCGIVGYTDLCLSLVEEGSELYGYLSRMVTASQRATDLIRQILAISRRDLQAKEPFLMDSLVKEVLRLLRATLPSTITIKKKLMGKPATVDADPSKIHQVLMNLATNAAHAMGDAGGELTVTQETITISPEMAPLYSGLNPGCYVRVSVSDTGEGIPPEIRAHIFEPFFTTKPEGVGTGLGLSTAHGIVTNHGGTIMVESEVEKGSTFHVYLPRIEAGAIHLESTPRFAGKIGIGQRILMVDDEPYLADIGEKMLLKLGFEVTIENDSAAALKTFQNDPEGYALVITDHNMPGMTGFDLADKIRRIRQTVPVILCSGSKNEQTDEKCRLLGINVFMQKPFNSIDLAQNVASALSLPDLYCNL